MYPRTNTSSATSRPALEQALETQGEDLTLLQYAERAKDLGQDVISVIVPTDHSRSILPLFFERLMAVLHSLGHPFEIIVVDDRSQDGTADYVNSLPHDYQISFFLKQGARGRSVSVKEGVDHALGGTIILLDPDLRYPPEAIPLVLEQLSTCDLVVANRKYRHVSFAYMLFSRFYRWIFSNLILAVDVDVRSGLKAFRRSQLSHLRFDPGFNPRLGFDALLLFYARRAGWTIRSVDVQDERVRFRRPLSLAIGSRAAVALGIVSIRLQSLSRVLFPFLYPPEPREYFEAGFTNINDYLFLAPEQSAKGHLTHEVKMLIGYFFILSGLYFWGIYLLTGKGFVWSILFHIAVVQVALILFKMFVIWRTYSRDAELPPVSSPESQAEIDALPVISVIMPVYKEKEVLPQLCHRMLNMRYPPEKLDIIFIFESGDDETIQAFLEQNMPPYFKGLVSPDVPPKTKPKALNVALRETKGDLLVIFDAETLPEPDQFLKAVDAFRRNPKLDYVHSRLDVYNSHVNWITRMYTAEFAFFYNFFLPGLATLEAPTPISGHSTYFRREQLIKVGGWDPYNLAEDCEIGIRLFRKGYRHATVIHSHTWEQSTTTLHDWLKQRTRWMQGFVQTSLVNARFPLLLWKDLGSFRNMLIFIFHVPGGVFLNGINFVQWCVLLFWWITRDPTIQSVFSGTLLYMSVTSFIVANVIFTYFNIIGLFSRKYYFFVHYAVLSFAYWFLLSLATIRAIVRFFRQESNWDKTTHSASFVHPTNA